MSDETDKEESWVYIAKFIVFIFGLYWIVSVIIYYIIDGIDPSYFSLGDDLDGFQKFLAFLYISNSILPVLIYDIVSGYLISLLILAIFFSGVFLYIHYTDFFKKPLWGGILGCFLPIINIGFSAFFVWILGYFIVNPESFIFPYALNDLRSEVSSNILRGTFEIYGALIIYFIIFWVLNIFFGAFIVFLKNKKSQVNID